MAYLTLTTRSTRRLPRRRASWAGCRIALAVAFALPLVIGSYAPSAEARGGRHGGHGARFVGGVTLGAVVARSYYAYPRPVYYAPPPVYYAPPVYYPPAPVAYASPPVYIEQPNYGAPAALPPAPALSIEERLRRLQAACGQGLLSGVECEAKRQELLRLM